MQKIIPKLKLSFSWKHNYDETVATRNQVKYCRQFIKIEIIIIIADYFYSILRCDFFVSVDAIRRCNFLGKKSAMQLPSLI